MGKNLSDIEMLALLERAARRDFDPAIASRISAAGHEVTRGDYSLDDVISLGREVDISAESVQAEFELLPDLETGYQALFGHSAPLTVSGKSPREIAKEQQRRFVQVFSDLFGQQGVDVYAARTLVPTVGFLNYHIFRGVRVLGVPTPWRRSKLALVETYIGNVNDAGVLTGDHTFYIDNPHVIANGQRLRSELSNCLLPDYTRTDSLRFEKEKFGPSYEAP